MDIRNRLLLVLMALSIMIIIDAGANGRVVLNRFLDGVLLISPVSSTPWSEMEPPPFLRKEGSHTYGAEGLQSVVVKGSGDVDVRLSSSGMLHFDFDVRTYGVSSRHVAPHHEQVDVTVVRRGDQLEISLEAPPTPSEVDGVRTDYRLQVPPGVSIHLENDGGDVHFHGLSGALNVVMNHGSVRVGEHAGPVEMKVSNGSIWLSQIHGDVAIEHENGRVEAVGVDGRLEVQGRRSTVTLDRIASAVDARLEEGVGVFYSVGGPLSIDAEMARIRVAQSEGDVKIDGRLSPVELVASAGPLQVANERGNVLLRLSPATAWNFDLDVRHGKIHSSLPAVDEARNSHGLVTVNVVRGDVTIEPL